MEVSVRKEGNNGLITFFDNPTIISRISARLGCEINIMTGPLAALNDEQIEAKQITLETKFEVEPSELIKFVMTPQLDPVTELTKDTVEDVVDEIIEFLRKQKIKVVYSLMSVLTEVDNAVEISYVFRGYW